jgi:soluble lytic murein transglycosylase
VYFRDLLRQFNVLEVALAAYNAGEHRAGPWLAERPYDETAEFVASIPITETREYVQIVLRNAEIYRRLYGNK